MVHSAELIVAGAERQWGACQRHREGVWRRDKLGKDLLIQTHNLSGSRVELLHKRRNVSGYIKICRASLGDVGHECSKSLIRARVLGAQASQPSVDGADNGGVRAADENGRDTSSI